MPKVTLLIKIVSVVVLINLCACTTVKDSYRTPPQYVDYEYSTDAFKIAESGKSATIYVDSQDWVGVIRAAEDLGNDIRKVTGVSSIVEESTQLPEGAIVIGTIGKSKLIDELIRTKMISVADIEGEWESFLIETVDGNLVVAGSDKRGTIYGIYDISEKIGVSPWYWWADVPVKKSNSLYVKAGRYIQDSPKVKYRGIFINDEEPSFGQWSRAKFGGINSQMYTHIFELLLRLKANYFWPAMWGKAFNEDDPLNPVLADQYGIVMGTSHHEPMMRAHKEYTSRKEEVGEWNYASNKTNLDKFFREGVSRNKDFDNLITIGMRGDGDVAISEEGDVENMRVLKEVIDGQRKIIGDVYQSDPSEIPQVWAVFTEVQRYYDAGFEVPEDVMLMFCDNNWGYIRRIGPLEERDRVGGLGLYYHIDMNGGPWNDRWVNTTTIPKLREQFNLAYQTGIDALWVVNVGDLKPKELPIDFIMRYAWNPDAIPADKTWDYTVSWATSIFGTEYAEEIADLVSKYSKYNLWRKPEVQVTNAMSLVNYYEADKVVELWQSLVSRAENLAEKISPEAQDAYYQLVLYPVKASAGVAEIYLAAGKNNLYAQQGRVSANEYADRARELFEVDKELSHYYNNTMSDGKWKYMMSDVHIGYEHWYMPEENKLPELLEVRPLPVPTLGVAVEGSELAWPLLTVGGEEGEIEPLLPTFDAINNQTHYIDIFNRGRGRFEFEVNSSHPWIRVSETSGRVCKEQRVDVYIDWSLVPEGESDGNVYIKHKDKVVAVRVKAIKHDLPNVDMPYYGGFAGEFSIPAQMYSANVSGKHAKWIELPDLGRSDACMGIEPVTAPSSKIKDAPVLEYTVYLPNKGETVVCLGVLPTQDIYPERGLRIAVGLDAEEPQIIDARKGIVDTFKEYTPENLEISNVLQPLPRHTRDIKLVGRWRALRNEVFDNIRWLDLGVEVLEPGIHTLKIYMIDPEVVLERIVVNPDNEHPSYFGAPSIKHNVKASENSEEASS